MAARTEHDWDRDPSPRRRRKFKDPKTLQRLLVLWGGIALVLLVVLGFLPSILGGTGLVNSMLASSFPDLNGTLQARSASLGWFSPVVLHQVELRDSRKELVATTPRLATDATFASLLFGEERPERLEIEKPELHLVVREGISNLEEIFAKYLETPASDQPLAVQVTGGTLAVTDAVIARTWKLTGLEFTYSYDPDQPAPTAVKASGTVATRPPGVFELEAGLAPVAQAADTAQPAGRFALQSKDLPLDLLSTLGERFAPGIRLEGSLNGKIACSYDPTTLAAGTSLTGNLVATGLVVTGPALAGDQLQMPQLRAQCDLLATGDYLDAKVFHIGCDLGDLELAGRFHLGNLRARQYPQFIRDHIFQTRGELDLAKVAAMLPATMRIRKETQITSGKLQFHLESALGDAGNTWTGQFEATDVRAQHQGREIVWTQPVDVQLAAHDTANGPIVDDLVWQSAYLFLQASGTRRNLAASAAMDLDALTRDLSQFVDLNGIALTGQGTAQASWTLSQEGRFETAVEAQFSDFQLAMAGQRNWKEPSLSAAFRAAGRLAAGQPLQLAEASVGLVAGKERLDAVLSEAVDEPSWQGPWPLEVAIRGQLDTWFERARVWGNPGLETLEGTLDAQGRIALWSKGVSWNGLDLRLANFRMREGAWDIREPSVRFGGDGRWEPAAGRLRLEDFSLQSSDLAARSKEMAVVIPPRGTATIEGALEVEGQLDGLQNWLVPVEGVRRSAIAGTLQGTAEFQLAGGRNIGQIDLVVDHLALVHPGGRRFDQPRVHLVGQGRYDRQSQTLEFERLLVESQALTAQWTGTTELATGRPVADLRGSARYDLQKLSELLGAATGGAGSAESLPITLAGKGDAPLAWKGPFSLQEGTGRVGLAWQSGTVLGFPLGPGQFQGRMTRGVLAVEPLELAVSEGRVFLAPEFHLTAAPADCTLGAGPLAQRVRITPRMCNAGLQYIAPVLAGVATAQGRFSIDLERCRFPLGNPAAGELVGRFTVHDVQVGPGPLVREMAALLGTVSGVQLAREAIVPFRMVQGRIYHERMDLIFPQITVSTSGSVGLDHTLALVAEMPIPPEWLRGRRVTTAMQGQTIRIPIGGTLEKPQLDRRTLEQYTVQFMGRTAENVIHDEVQRGLDRLLRPQQ